jgi:hypothetical protein
MSVSNINPISIGDGFDISVFSSNTYSYSSHHNHADVTFTVPAGDTVQSSFVESANDGSADNAYLNQGIQFFDLPTVFADGTGIDEFAFQITKDFFEAHVEAHAGTVLTFTVTLTAVTPSGQSDGVGSYNFQAFLNQFSSDKISNDHYGITRAALSGDVASEIATSIDLRVDTEAHYVSGLLQSVANTTIPMVAVEGSMYDHVGSAQEIDGLVNGFLPAQVANAAKYGLNQQVYACEVLGLAFAAGDENHATTFATNYGPSNGSMPNTATGDAAFASAASQKIFGSAALQHTPDAIANYVANWKAFYTAHGVPGILNPTADQIDLYARGAAWGDAVGVALAGNLGQLPVLTTNFLEDAAQAHAIYSASLAAQPTPGPFEGAASSASAASPVQLAGIPADPQHIDM